MALAWDWHKSPKASCFPGDGEEGAAASALPIHPCPSSCPAITTDTKLMKLSPEPQWANAITDSSTLKQQHQEHTCRSTACPLLLPRPSLSLPEPPPQCECHAQGGRGCHAQCQAAAGREEGRALPTLQKAPCHAAKRSLWGQI